MSRTLNFVVVKFIFFSLEQHFVIVFCGKVVLDDRDERCLTVLSVTGSADYGFKAQICPDYRSWFVSTIHTSGDVIKLKCCSVLSYTQLSHLCVCKLDPL